MSTGEKEAVNDLDVEELQRCVRDLVALSALPAVWLARDRPQIVESLADALRGMLDLQLVYIRYDLPGRPALEVVRSVPPVGVEGDLRLLETLRQHLNGDGSAGESSPVITLGERRVRPLITRFGYGQSGGVLIAAAARPGFPGRGDRLLLEVAANQAAAMMQQYRIESALSESSQHLRALFENTLDAVVLADDQGRLVDVNPAACHLTGYHRSELLRLSVIGITPAPNRQQGMEAWRQFLRDGRQSGEYQMRRKDGSLIDIEYRAVANILPGLHLSSMRDITARKRAEQALQESEERFRSLSRCSPVGIFMTDTTGNCTYTNPRCQAIGGFTHEQGLGAGWLDFIHPGDRGRIRNQWLAAAQQARAYAGNFRFAHPGGQVRWVHLSTAPILSDAGALVGHVATVEDITDRRRAEQERERLLASERQMRDEAERANRAKDQFIAVLSHELRTPLTPVLLSVSELQSDQRLPEDLREQIQIVRQNVELEARLIDDLLDLTRIARGKLQLHPDTTDVHTLARNAVSICCVGEGPAVQIDLQADEHHVRGDASRLQQVLWNLLSNAWKFTPATGKIIVRSRNTAEGAIEVQVSDTGMGIQPDLLPQVFNAFDQGEAALAGRKSAGLGLGLTISRAIMSAHGGSLTAHSAGRGKGATFIVTLPTVVPAQHQSDAPGGPAAPPPPGLRILLVEDHAATLELMQRLLTRSGHTVAAATSIKTALAAAETQSFDLVISDLGLPDGRGHEMMRVLQQRYGLRGIALSGYGMEEDVRRSREAGFSEHVTKPIDLPRLQAAIAQVAASAPLGPPAGETKDTLVLLQPAGDETPQ